MIDPYPRKILLGRREVMELLSMDRTTWYEFLADQTTGFPKPVIVGRTPNGNPRHRFKKSEVLAWIDSLNHDTEPAADPGQGRRKKS